tara:strand:+ start:516 stop:617 length:102 start_codon:yes stop_codon:yes gene_type:complete
VNKKGILEEEIWNTSGESFSKWFRKLNKECSVE